MRERSEAWIQMTYLYRLAGDNLELAEAELEGFLKSQGLENKIERENQIAQTEEHPSQLRRLALTHEVVKEVDIEEYRPQGSYAVRAENLSDQDFDTQEIERKIGEKVSGSANKVDLENPETVIKVYKTGESIFYGELVEDIPRGLFKKRSNEKRPFSSPISLDPVLARVMVNLSEVSAGEKVLDPFCGTGGILIEAGLCGIGVKGLDIQQEMVEGTQENLEEYGIISHEIKQGDISEVNDLFDDYNAVLADLPYGKASKKTEKPVEKFLEFLENYNGRAVFMYNEEVLGPYSAEFSIYVHKSLERFIYVI